MGFLDEDILYPTQETEGKKHKLKRLVQSPNSHFLDIRCPNCYNITTVFSHAQNVIVCSECNQLLCSPTGGKSKIAPRNQFRVKEAL